MSKTKTELNTYEGDKTQFLLFKTSHKKEKPTLRYLSDCESESKFTGSQMKTVNME